LSHISLLFMNQDHTRPMNDTTIPAASVLAF